MAVVFPCAGGAIASCSRAPEVHICRTRDACPVSGRCRSRPFQQGKIDDGAVDDGSVADAGDGDERCSASRMRWEV
jgi:hypothetical protein